MHAENLASDEPGQRQIGEDLVEMVVQIHGHLLCVVALSQLVQEAVRSKYQISP